MNLSMLDLLAMMGIIALVVAIAATVKDVFSRSKDEELERLRKENRELRKEIKEVEEGLRRRYERLLAESAIKNALMVGLWKAYQSGELNRCYKGGGYVKVLADGSVICRKPVEEESYVIKPEASLGEGIE